MRLRMLMPIALVGLLGLSFQPAPAAGYDVDYGIAHGAEVNVRLWSGGTAKVTLLVLEVVKFVNEGLERRLPITTVHKVGCITLKTPFGNDGGCTLLPKDNPQATINIDAAMTQATLTITVASKLIPNKQVIASLILKGDGAITLRDTGALFQDGTNYRLTSGPLLQRGAKAVGSVRSEALGCVKDTAFCFPTGNVVDTLSPTAYYQGVGGYIFAHK